MAQKGRLKVVRESDTGRNQRFQNTRTGQEMSRAEVVRRIKQGEYEDYHVRKVNGIETPAANPDGKKGNNLG